MAPEILGLKEKAYDGKIDIWSVGCMVMEMWTGEKPWGSGEHFLSILMKVWNIMHVGNIYKLNPPFR
jgi:mitogen-activated protein kinase kinase kinase